MSYLTNPSAASEKELPEQLETLHKSIRALQVMLQRAETRISGLEQDLYQVKTDLRNKGLLPPPRSRHGRM